MNKLNVNLVTVFGAVQDSGNSPEINGAAVLSQKMLNKTVGNLVQE